MPTRKSVIHSSSDTRYLYRNVVQTALDNVNAEFVYQLKNGFEDVADLVGLLGDAQVSSNKWVRFIPGEDVQEALGVVKREQTS